MTDPYEIIWLPRALKQLARIDLRDRRRIVVAGDSLSTNPTPHGSKKIVGPDDLYRIRVGDFRIVYAIEHDRLIVIVITVGHRRDVYSAVNG